MVFFSFRTHFINKSIFNSTKRRSRPTDLGKIYEPHLKENNLHQRQEHWLVVYGRDRWIAVCPYCPIYAAFRAHFALRTDGTSLMHLLVFMLVRDRKWSHWSGWAPFTIKTTSARKTVESLPYQRWVLMHTVKPTTLMKSETVRNDMHTLLRKSQRLFCLHIHYQHTPLSYEPIKLF